ncbi:hypothetical protein BDF20DRAFT_855204 [Mycotypha africana]|uniref:uncharacterized protein n=1 Tax=Mycotypha africana TaxID=64632 RepID=UPI00230122EE|nr:uncharacterized protein BDF20DRAFT_855204 [Mycotypha africana]KAI8988341.1 hypothetical protein BDF20DRAFT_855204 [Mycotypha africana]
MKSTVIFKLIAAIAVSSVSAQQAASSPTAGSSISPVVVVASATSSISTPEVPAATPSSTSSCPVQSTFELCLKNEDNYIKTCQEQDYACLCRWHKEKLTCWNNCPHDLGLPNQQALVNDYCSRPGANVSIAPWTSSAPATSATLAPTQVAVNTPSSSPTAATNKPSSASNLLAHQSGAVLAAGAAAIAAYMFL